MRQHTFKQKRARTFDKISLYLMAELAHRMQIQLLALDFDLRRQERNERLLLPAQKPFQWDSDRNYKQGYVLS